jgi:hypothetical protein
MMNKKTINMKFRKRIDESLSPFDKKNNPPKPEMIEKIKE